MLFRRFLYNTATPSCHGWTITFLSGLSWFVGCLWWLWWQNMVGCRHRCGGLIEEVSLLFSNSPTSSEVGTFSPDSFSCTLLRLSSKPPAVFTTYDLGWLVFCSTSTVTQVLVRGWNIDTSWPGASFWSVQGDFPSYCCFCTSCRCCWCSWLHSMAWEPCSPPL